MVVGGHTSGHNTKERMMLEMAVGHSSNEAGSDTSNVLDGPGRGMDDKCSADGFEAAVRSVAALGLAPVGLLNVVATWDSFPFVFDTGLPRLV